MSDYFRALSRLRGSPTNEPAPSEPVETTGVRHLPTGTSSARADASGDAIALGALLGTLRALATTSDAPAVVVAGISGNEPVGAIVSGLVEQAADGGLRIFVGNLTITRGHRVLGGQSLEEPARAAAPLTEAVAAPFEPPKVDLSSTGGREEAAKWLQEASAGRDLVLIEAPPLLTSVEGALLAKRGDGLVLVVEPLVTKRSELKMAVERCEAAGCRLVGLVSCTPARSLGNRLKSLLRLDSA